MIFFLAYHPRHGSIERGRSTIALDHDVRPIRSAIFGRIPDTTLCMHTRSFHLVVILCCCISWFACGQGGQQSTDGARADRLKAAEQRSPEVDAPSREDVLLIKRMETATTEEVKQYISEVVQMELPPDFVVPQDIVDAGHPKLAAEVIADRYPEFSGREGMSLVEAVRANPVLYRQVVMESKAMRQVYKDHETVRPSE